MFLRAHPLCVACSASRVTRLATVVDHIVPHRGDLGLFWSQANWQALCVQCHATKTHAETLGGTTTPQQ
jgi:5-methylcytosine-specific restriction protein A